MGALSHRDKFFKGVGLPKAISPGIYEVSEDAVWEPPSFLKTDFREAGLSKIISPKQAS